ncbi:hypothetical protein GH714_013839 [Hevea brasiliensis]|uniref:Prephenate dehydratase domain-containing protein n=1 Tax=Hevea brasiliensis TaxID=3981 RepID=A0A6A6LGC4_HEVBR|nr:hypothetical protein GH714_013839 [Hevea brasiliensis]
MAPFVIRSLVNLPGQIAVKHLPTDQFPRIEIKLPLILVKPRHNTIVLASLHGENERAIEADGKNTQAALQLQDSPYDVVSRDALPRPLSSSQSSSSVSDGSRLRVAYQGVRGAYSESAAEKAYPNCEAVPCEQFDAAFESSLPIENSLGGSIHRNYDLLLRHRLHIVGEVKYAVRHCLLANHGVKVEDLKRVLSHPQALAQCEHTLTSLGLVREAVDDTAGAAKHVALHKLKDTGAVASSVAAKIYGLNILAEDIQGANNPGTDRPFKTSIVFSLEEGPGVLSKHLLFLLCGKSTLLRYFDYLFYVDFEASMADQNAQNALKHLKVKRRGEMSRKLRFFKDQINKAGILSSAHPVIEPDFELEELEIQLAEHEHELIEMNSNNEKLQQSYNELLEKACLILRSFIWVEIHEAYLGAPSLGRLPVGFRGAACLA